MEQVASDIVYGVVRDIGAMGVFKHACAAGCAVREW